MNAENRCPVCHAELAANAPRGLCPACLLQGGLPSQNDAIATSPGVDFVPPAPKELAGYFPDLEILELLGFGGMGVVYKARQRRLGRLVALKILSPKVAQDPAFAERFAREARALAMLNHPQIVAVHDFGQTAAPQAASEGGTEGLEDGLYYFVMEFVDGTNLRRLLEGGRLAPEAALAIVPQICDALQYAHDHGVVHRDIKPENILLDKEGRVKIADFGIAKLVAQEVAEAPAAAQAEAWSRPLDALTEVGQVVGTPPYMAPEQRERPAAVDHRADIYSLGVVFYQMLTGELPAGRFVPPSHKVQLDVRLDEVVLRSLEKEPERRYQQASEIKTQVQTIVTTPPSEKAPGSVSWAWRAVPWQVWVVVALLALEGVGNLLSLPSEPRAAQWLFAKGVFVLGLTRGWRWVFVLFQAVAALHVYGLASTAPLGSLLNLLLMGLVGSAYRYFFYHSVPRGSLMQNRTWKSAARTVASWLLIAFCVTLVVFDWNDLLAANSLDFGRGRSARPEIARVLEDYRQTLVGYDLGFRSVFPHEPWKFYDAARLQEYPTREAWPADVLGHVDTDPQRFTVLSPAPEQPHKTVTGPYAFTIPWESTLLTEAYATLLFLKGISPRGFVEATSYTSLVCQGNMEGRLRFDSYATALVRGDVSGQISSRSYFDLVVTGKFSGKLRAESYAMIYLAGGCQGEVELDNGGKLFIAGRTSEADLARIHGHGSVFLEDAELPPGLHQIGDLAITVGKEQATANAETPFTANDNAGQLTQQGWKFWQQQQFPEAIEAFQKAVQLDPKNVNAWNGLGWAQFNSGDPAEAEKTFQHAVELAPKHAAILNGLGQVKLAQGKYAEAETYLLKAAPQAPAAAWGLTKVYLLQGNFEAAEKWAQKIVDSSPGDEGARKMLEAAKAKHLSDELRAMIAPPVADEAGKLSQQGWTHAQQGHLADAIESFQKAVRLTPKSANAWNGLGWAQFNSGDPAEAEKAFQHALELEPKHPAALNGLGQIKLAQGKYAEAETYLLKAAPTAPAAWWGLTRVYLLQGKFEAAEKWAQKIVDSSPHDDGARKMLEAAKSKYLSDELRATLAPTLLGAEESPKK